MKKGYALLISLLLITLISFIAINILQNKAFFSQLITLKYLELQGKIHQGKAQEYYKNHNTLDGFVLDDKRFVLHSELIEDNKTIFYIEAINEPIRLVSIFEN